MNRVKHFDRREIILTRHIDKMVFGRTRAVTEMRHKTYRIHGGNVQVKFRGKWQDVVETRAYAVNSTLRLTQELAQQAGRPYFGCIGQVKLA